jgi:ATP-binding protein involved in chromosome partitioning
MSVTKETVLEALRAVPGPHERGDIVSQGLVSEIVVAGKDVMFAINVDPAEAAHLSRCARRPNGRCRTCPASAR